MSKDIKTDEKKQHFDDIYVQPTPVPYKTEILDKLEYISDNFNREMFDAHILEFCQKKSGTVRLVDLCACFGNTTMATVRGMTYREICDNWKDEESCRTIQKPTVFDCHVTAIDISSSAMAYGTKVGLYDTSIVCNLNDRGSDAFSESVQAMKEADVLISTAALVYLDLETVEALVEAFASKSGEGYALVNFLNPFALEKADQTKQILLKHLEFVGSRATRHRRMSPLEQSNYPGEEWSLLELWALKRRSS
jgi:ligand-binding sensor protein